VRVAAVLIGEDALEGGVSLPADLTGGQVFVPLGSDVPAAMLQRWMMPACRSHLCRRRTVVQRSSP
jgi:hypothetical protein